MKRINIIFKITLIVLIIFLLLVLFIPSRTPKIEGNNSVALIEKVEIGGIDQYIMIRGRNINNPILLFLHGGPGYSQISYARKYQEELEDGFIVVNWDQRGSGKSFSLNIPKETMNRERFETTEKHQIKNVKHSIYFNKYIVKNLLQWYNGITQNQHHKGGFLNAKR